MVCAHVSLPYMIYLWSEKQWSVQVETLYHTISLGVKTGQKFTSVTADMQDRIIPTLQLINRSCFVHDGQLARVPFLPLKQTAESYWLCDLLMGEPFQPTGLSPAVPALPDKRLMKPISWLAAVKILTPELSLLPAPLCHRFLFVAHSAFLNSMNAL